MGPIEEALDSFAQRRFVANLLDRTADGIHVTGYHRDCVASQKISHACTTWVIPTMGEDGIQTGGSLGGELVEEGARRSVYVCEKDEPR